MLMCFETFLLRGNEQLTLRQCLLFSFSPSPTPLLSHSILFFTFNFGGFCWFVFWSSSKCMFSLSMKVAVPRYLMLSAPQQVLFAAARLWKAAIIHLLSDICWASRTGTARLLTWKPSSSSVRLKKGVALCVGAHTPCLTSFQTCELSLGNGV